MISDIEAAKQIERLSQLDYFPREKNQAAALKELRLAVESANTVEIAALVIADIMAYQTETPKPAALRAAIWEMNEKLKSAPPPIATSAPSASSHCGRCQGFGYFGGYIGGPRHAPWQWCDCKNAKRAQFESPNLVDEANRVRDKLIKRFAGNLASMVKTDGLQRGDDGYLGEF
jgi:hypothetical protein